MRDQVYETLLELIVDQELSPEEKLTDKGLALQLGVSRTPVRESIRRLEDEGFVITAANQWTRVAPIDLQQAEDLVPIIRELETLALSTSMRRLGETDFSAMERINDALGRAIRRGRGRTAALLDTELHATLVASCGNAEVISMLRQLKLKIRRIEQFFFHDQLPDADAVEEHAALLDALRDGDEELARACLRENWDRNLVRLRAAAHENAR